jgi:hypothetical protein
MQALVEIGSARGYGYSPLLGYAKFLSSGGAGAQTLVDNFGIKSIVASATGIYTVNLTDTLPNFVAHAEVVAPAAEFHKCSQTSCTPASRTVVFTHVFAATYATIASAPAAPAYAANGVEVQVFIYGRASL